MFLATLLAVTASPAVLANPDKYGHSRSQYTGPAGEENYEMYYSGREYKRNPEYRQKSHQQYYEESSSSSSGFEFGLPEYDEGMQDYDSRLSSSSRSSSSSSSSSSDAVQMSSSGYRNRNRSVVEPPFDL